MEIIDFIKKNYKEYKGDDSFLVNPTKKTKKINEIVEELDNQILLNRRKILEGNGKISHEEAIKKAEKEFEIYREREMKELQSDFDLMYKTLKDKNDDKKEN